ncbi:hypothetical protein EPN42_05190 [bacterium]|nr:MAG: hypothetical protein EPN42_05190 [bacterium]
MLQWLRDDARDAIHDLVGSFFASAATFGMMRGVPWRRTPLEKRSEAARYDRAMRRVERQAHRLKPDGRKLGVALGHDLDCDAAGLRRLVRGSDARAVDRRAAQAHGLMDAAIQTPEMHVQQDTQRACAPDVQKPTLAHLYGPRSMAPRLGAKPNEYEVVAVKGLDARAVREAVRAARAANGTRLFVAPEDPKVMATLIRELARQGCTLLNRDAEQQTIFRAARASQNQPRSISGSKARSIDEHEHVK